MENGTLSILQAKSGKLIARVTFTKSDGKTTGIIDISFWSPVKDDLKYDSTPCEFQRDKGLLVKVKTNDGRIIEKSMPQSQPAVGGGVTPSGSSTRSASISDSYAPNMTLLPRDTKDALVNINPDNFALKWQKAARYVRGQTSEKDKFMFFKRDRKGENFEIQPNYGDLDFTQIAKRELENAKAILGDNRAQSMAMTTQWRMVQGLGIESVYETSMTLHHVYGIPYIPASALKGMVRSWIIVTEYGGKEEIALSDQRFCDWFGCPAELMVEEESESDPKKKRKRKHTSHYKEARKGELVFFDAFPQKKPRLEIDVMNPHYSPYYSDKTGQTPPADYHNPIPVFFLTVGDTSFQFIVGSHNSETLQQSLKSKNIFDWLKFALENHGIGAKTAVGYGYMNSINGQ